MKNLALPFLLLTIAAGQAIRIESVHAEESAEAAKATTRAEALAQWHAEPYPIEPPDVLLITLKWNDFDAVINQVGEFPKLGNVPIGMDLKGVQSFQQVKGGAKVKAKEASLTGKYLVGPDGKITIEGFTKLFVAGMTTEETSKAIAESIPKRFGRPNVSVEVARYNSKVVYVITKSGSGDNVSRIPLPYSENFTVLDALASVEMKADVIDLAYVLSSYGLDDSEDRLDIDLKVLRSIDNDSANIKLLPGDRIFIRNKTSPTDKNSFPSAVTPSPEARVSSNDGTEQNQDQESRYVVCYSVADIVKSADGNGDVTAEQQKMDELIDSITSTVDVEQWVKNGGEANEIKPFPANRSLVVSCTKGTHDKLAIFLAALREGRKLKITMNPSYPQVQVLGPLTTGGQPGLLDPPSDAEVLKNLPNLLATGVNATVTKEMVKSYIDPERTYPLVGPAVQHHAVYKCRVKSGEKQQTVYVNHHHLHVTP